MEKRNSDNNVCNIRYCGIIDGCSFVETKNKQTNETKQNNKIISIA